MPQDENAAPVHPELSGFCSTVSVEILARRLAKVVAGWMSDEARESYQDAIEQVLRAHESWHSIRDRRVGTCPTPATADRETAMEVPAAVDPVAVAIADASYRARAVESSSGQRQLFGWERGFEHGKSRTEGDCRSLAADVGVPAEAGNKIQTLVQAAFGERWLRLGSPAGWKIAGRSARRNLQGGRNVLHITRREWESVHVSGEADILVRRIGRGRVELSIAAPAETRIVRSDAKRREPKPALTTERENG
jgi:sRNA-binding carbon storage regulator CsrA